MSPPARGEGGIPRGRRGVAAPPGAAATEETWQGANEAKVEKLRGRSLRRQAAAQGFEIRHSAYGYALIDTARKPVDDRNNMTLDEIEQRLDRPPGQ